MSDSFSRVLAARRGYFNARFAEKQISRPNLDGDEFFRVLREQVAPAVEAVSQVNADAALIAGQSLYDLALDLFAQGLLGDGARDRSIPRVWTDLLPSLAPLIAQQPQRVPASVINGAYNLAQTPGARLEQWMQIIRALASTCDDADIFLRAGQVAAWRAGMAHFRLGALAILKTLDGQIIRAIFGMADEQKIDTNTLLYALMSNPWYDPAQPNTEKQIKIVRRVGAFRGFGGTFLEPPRIAWTNIGFVAGDNADHWLLMADAFGATLHATEKADSVSISSPFKLERGGRIKNGEASATFPELADVTSYAASQNTLAVTTDLTHAIYLIAFS